MAVAQGIGLNKLEPHSWSMAVGDTRPGARYEVLLDGVKIGEVEKCSEESYRSDGTTSRLRYGFRGYSVYWHAQTAQHERVGFHHYTRTAAVEALANAARQAINA